MIHTPRVFVHPNLLPFGLQTLGFLAAGVGEEDGRAVPPHQLTFDHRRDGALVDLVAMIGKDSRKRARLKISMAQSALHSGRKVDIQCNPLALTTVRR